jgi:hypothetical protein
MKGPKGDFKLFDDPFPDKGKGKEKGKKKKGENG